MKPYRSLAEISENLLVNLTEHYKKPMGFGKAYWYIYIYMYIYNIYIYIYIYVHIDTNHRILLRMPG